MLLAASFTATPIANAEETKTIADESIYDLLVDRYFNATGENDYNIDPTESSQFAGGDFKGITDKISVISDMGFTIVSLGSIFKTEEYDGSMVTSYTEFEPRFGTTEEFTQLIDKFNDYKISVMVDFPLTNVSEKHEWAQDSSKEQWVLGTSNSKVRWDLNNREVQKALIDEVVQFVSTYKVRGIRLTNLDIASNAFLNDIIKAIKAVDENIYVISNEESDANFDAKYYNDTNEIFRNIYKNVDIDSSEQMKYIAPGLNNGDVPVQLMIDSVNTNRFVYDVELFPPTRIKLAMASTLLLPGVPVMQYGTEIAMNGEVGPESHQVYNFRTDEELIKFIGNIQTLRNESDTLRAGEFKLIKNENGLLAFQRSSDTEKWIVVINNTGKTTRVDISEEDIGSGKEIMGMIETNVIRANDDGVYPIVIDREVVEIYQVIEKRGINIGYLILLVLAYTFFIGFILVLRRRTKRAEEK